MRVLAPKVKGSLALDAALRGVRLDFLVLFSSVSSVLGLEGQCDYAAANAFLDAFALRKSKRDGLPSDAGHQLGCMEGSGLSGQCGEIAPQGRGRPSRLSSATPAIGFSRSTPFGDLARSCRGPDIWNWRVRHFKKGSSAPAGVEIGNVVFQSPFLVGAAESKELSITLTTLFIGNLNLFSPAPGADSRDRHLTSRGNASAGMPRPHRRPESLQQPRRNIRRLLAAELHGFWSALGQRAEHPIQ